MSFPINPMSHGNSVMHPSQPKKPGCTQGNDVGNLIPKMPTAEDAKKVILNKKEGGFTCQGPKVSMVNVISGIFSSYRK
jgi:hypothetical protein